MRRPKPVSVYGCCGRKIAYDAWDDAEQACLEVYDRYGTPNYAYHCEHCRKWHISKFTHVRLNRNYGQRTIDALNRYFRLDPISITKEGVSCQSLRS